jgi:hypothetical protein
VQPTNLRQRFFMFLNSLGSFEVLRFTGISEIDANMQGEMIQKHLPFNYDALGGEMAAGYKTFIDKSEISTGFFANNYGKQWQEYMKEFMLSRQVYELIGNTRKPVIVMPGNLKYFISQDYEHYARFEIMDVYQDENFTPADI